MTITIRVEGAQPEEIVRGLLAAQEVFDKAGVTPNQAAMARFVVEGWDIRGFTGKVPEDELAICTVWDEADQAAVQACCAGWPADKVPGSADLELVREPQRFSFSSEEERSEWRFQTADAGILERCARKATLTMAARKMRLLSCLTTGISRASPRSSGGYMMNASIRL